MNGHYKRNGVDLFQCIRDGLMEEGHACGFCEGNVFKYLLRYKYKDGLNDLYKARDYLDLLIELNEQDKCKGGV